MQYTTAGNTNVLANSHRKRINEVTTIDVQLFESFSHAQENGIELVLQPRQVSIITRFIHLGKAVVLVHIGHGRGQVAIAVASRQRAVVLMAASLSFLRLS